MKINEYQYPRTITQVNKYIHNKYPDIDLVRGEGYFYITSDDDVVNEKLAGLYTTSIPVFSIRHQTFDTWMNDIENLLLDVNRHEVDRQPVYEK